MRDNCISAVIIYYFDKIYKGKVIKRRNFSYTPHKSPKADGLYSYLVSGEAHYPKIG